MVEATYKIDGMTCGSCAMNIEKALQAMAGIQSAHVTFKTRKLSLVSEQNIDRQSIIDLLSRLGHYSLKDHTAEQEPQIYSILVWGILGSILISAIFYLIQVLGMQSWTSPTEFLTDSWYLVVPLIIGFGIQAGLFRAIHLLTQHGGGGVIASSSGVSGSTMLACCMHNLVPLFPILGASGLATFFAAYQTQVFLFSMAVTALGIGYMIRMYSSLKRACKTHHNK